MKIAKLDAIMKEIAKLYFVALRNINFQFFNSSDSGYSPFKKYYSDVEFTFSQLDKEKQTLITKEYFYDGYRNWWIDLYSPSKFLKLKKNAVKEFVEVFYAIH